MQSGPGRGGPAQHGRAVLSLAILVLPVAAAISAAVPKNVTGRVTDAAGESVANAQVSATVPGGLGDDQVLTDAAGRYTVRGGWPLAPPLVVTAPGFAPARTAGGGVVVHRWPRISGRAVDDTGARLEGALVTLSHSRQVWTAVTDAEGRFTVLAAGGAGTAWLAVQAERHEPAYETPALMLDREVRLLVTLPRLLGTIRLDSDPSGQTPVVDGAAFPGCTQTPCELAMGIGPHHLEFTPELYVPWAQDVQVDRGTVAAVTARLERKTGTLRLAPPLHGELTVDGRAVDGGGWTGEVPTGKHSIAFRSPTTWPVTTEVDVAWKQTAEAKLAPAAITPGDDAAFLRDLQAYLSAAGGSYGVYVESLASGATLAVNQDNRMVAASVIKLPVALYLLHQAEGGQVNLDDQVDLHDEDFMAGTGSLNGTAHAGDRFSYTQLLALMIQQSDNTAWRALTRVLGTAQVDAFAAAAGAGDCRQRDDACTAREAGQLLSQLARGRLLSQTSTQTLLNLLETTVFNDRINYYLNGIAVAHKVGMDGGVINDCGVVYLPGSPFTVCVFSATNDPAVGTQVIRDVARAAARYHGR